ncbi:MAG: hypothetical protein P4L75_00045, partial [Clostridia bacterium]|nr:hypothetical protein [Clostridia bacterium]
LNDFGKPLLTKFCHRCWVDLVSGGQTTFWLDFVNGVKTVRKITPAGGDGIFTLRCDPDYGSSQGFMAGARRAQGDNGAFGVAGILCSAKTGRNI